ncbi:MAG: hypothetical protein ACRC5A_04595 [Enterobacteriaceae bacterium]
MKTQFYIILLFISMIGLGRTVFSQAGETIDSVPQATDGEPAQMPSGGIMKPATLPAQISPGEGGNDNSSTDNTIPGNDTGADNGSGNGIDAGQGSGTNTGNDLHPVQSTPLNSQLELLVVDDQVANNSFVTTLNSTGGQLTGSSKPALFGVRQGIGENRHLAIWSPHDRESHIQRLYVGSLGSTN